MKKKDLLLLIMFVGIIFVSINVFADNKPVSCTGVFNQDFIDSINKYLFTPLKWLTPVALLILTSIDFAGVVLSGDKKGMDKAKNNFLKRSAAALIIFFAPLIINLILSLIQNESIRACINKIK